MGKKLIYLLLAVFLGGFIVLQSCNESPVVPTYNDNKEEPYGHTSGTFTDPRTFAGIDNGFPKLCPGLTQKLELWSGRPPSSTFVGYIEFYPISGQPNKIKVRYVFENPSPGYVPWSVTQIHFMMGDALNDIKQNPQGCPTPGRFTINLTFSPPFTGNYKEFEYTLPPDNNQDGFYFVAAHAVVYLEGSAAAYRDALPNGIVHYNLERNYTNGYFKIDFGDDAGFLSTYDPPGSDPPGTFYGFCIDKDKLANLGDQCGILYSSYGEALPPEILGSTGIEFPDNFDLINYLINHYSIGGTIPGYKNDGAKIYPFDNLGGFQLEGGDQIITLADMQNAIWSLIDDMPPSSSWMNPRNPNAVWGLIYAVMNNNAGEGFVPGCYQKIVTILVPVDECTGNPQWDLSQFITFQPMIFDVGIPCTSGQEETAWGDGKEGGEFACSNWATYFKWGVNCPPSAPR